MARDNLAVLETHNMAAGPVAVTATVMDDRNLLASASANVEVEPEAAAPAASKLTNISFQRNSAYVNNVSKAVLDDVALRLQQDSGSSAVIVGSSGSGEAQKLSEKRAENARIYLIRNKGIDAKRVMVQQSSRGNGNSEIWWVPAGAQLPENP
jgi:outer membrane protein OmpA-like peptidoglycan-associated protein